MPVGDAKLRWDRSSDETEQTALLEVPEPLRLLVNIHGPQDLQVLPEPAAVPLVTGDGPKGSHLAPDAPRAIQRWNGYAWGPHGPAANLAEAQRLLHPRAAEPPTVTAPRPQPLRAGRGRHREPRPGE
ncbi:DUF6087 family protein [Streptomyces sp. NPDC026589]|uniref:DUF6087 family protein n=1 Tax=Streptomyces sp. NPDC026589 TaxID=3155609 RepID=UPI003405A2BD